MQEMEKKTQTQAELEAAAQAEEELLDRVVDEAGRAVEEAIRDHKRAGNPITECPMGELCWCHQMRSKTNL